MSLSVGERQRIFTLNISKLITFAYDNGFELTVGDAYRDERSHGPWGKQGSYGRKHSLHKMRLAMDFNLFKDGKYMTQTDDHLVLGAYWETLHELNIWGGRFGDGNHYSMQWRQYK